MGHKGDDDWHRGGREKSLGFSRCPLTKIRVYEMKLAGWLKFIIVLIGCVLKFVYNSMLRLHTDLNRYVSCIYIHIKISR